MHVAEIWRYPVKSLAGESLRGARVGPDGIPGDRLVHVAGEGNKLITARTRPGLLGLRGAFSDADGRTTVDGLPWDDPEVAERVRAAAGEQARLIAYAGRDRFDALPLLVTTDGAVEAFGHDRRRLRPNLVIGGVEGLAEREWPGGTIRIGDCVIGVDSLCVRCALTTVDPDTLEQDPGVLRDINERFDSRLALNCAVLRAGEVAVGDPVEV